MNWSLGTGYPGVYCMAPHGMPLYLFWRMESLYGEPGREYSFHKRKKHEVGVPNVSRRPHCEMGYAVIFHGELSHRVGDGERLCYHGRLSFFVFFPLCDVHLEGVWRWRHYNALLEGNDAHLMGIEAFSRLQYDHLVLLFRQMDLLGR